MSHRDNLVTVLEVACLTADRSPEEQRAMLAVALKLDIERGAFVQANYRGNLTPVAPCLVKMVTDTSEPSAAVVLTVGQSSQYARLQAKWRPCEKCSEPLGAHGLNNRCPKG